MAATHQPADNATWPLYTGPSSSLGVMFANATVPGPIDFSICEIFDQIDALELKNATSTSTSADSGRTGSDKRAFKRKRFIS